MLARAALSIGANLGDRGAALQWAVDHLRTVPGVRQLRVSPVYETEPVGGVDQPDFLNIVVVLDAETRNPRDLAWLLLESAHDVEAELGRVRDTRWGPRTLDVDVLAVEALRMPDPELTLPHPRLAERAFVLVPWAAVDPDFDVPGLGRVADLLAQLPAQDRLGVRRRHPHA